MIGRQEGNGWWWRRRPWHDYEGAESRLIWWFNFSTWLWSTRAAFLTSKVESTSKVGNATLLLGNKSGRDHTGQEEPQGTQSGGGKSSWERIKSLPLPYPDPHCVAGVRCPTSLCSMSDLSMGRPLVSDDRCMGGSKDVGRLYEERIWDRTIIMDLGSDTGCRRRTRKPLLPVSS